MVERKHTFLSVVRQCRLLDISRSSVYYRSSEAIQEDLEYMRLMDRQYLATPFYGSRRFSVWLRKQGYCVNRKRVRRLMRIMGLRAIYRRPRTSKPGLGHRIYPYLLGGMEITRPNQVWAADITYIPMARGFLYLVTINGLVQPLCDLLAPLKHPGADFCVEALEEALRRGQPDIFNTDQGSQFTSEAFTELLKQHGVRISMDGKGRYRDNIFVERLWRTVKYEEVYLKAYQDGRDARNGLGEYFRFYNNLRPHQALGYRTPAEVFASRPTEATNGGMVKSLTLDTLRTAGHDLNKAPILS